MNFKHYRLWTILVFTVLLVVISAPTVNGITPPNHPVQIAQATEDDSEQVTQATLDYLLADVTEPAQTPSVTRTTIVETYALTTWQWGETGGQTVLELTDENWQVLVSGGGAVDAATLVSFGVPADIAEQLMAQDASGD
ncbi:hypothetical protein [Leptothoe sp. PORK10 BA2]|uniref:hypothetical protein n=1 Tax=Leptothoe sp. PORK10 BA2 TaxID=3110254 RepID=UPI002B2122E2|nr:hypothetical protein [Leptothoe sp. PORK10 BA2]MEA5464058.1 hypothetical protein [Leptothoe sp. PORK10 BA2]